jgi:tetratricopeptide (TPR) repeat protein
MAPADGYYLAAKSAIDRRDYGTALELLQAARTRRADDANVLNAMGVVYDKLGRFDLSARYYAQAAALDPGSAIIAHNQAYSNELRALQGDPSRVLVASAAAPPVRAEAVAPVPVAAVASLNPRLVPAGANVLRLELPAPVQVAANEPAPGWRTLTVYGAHLMVINATGRPDGADPVRLALVEKGWSARKLAIPDPAPEAITTISYPSSQSEAAAGLARTLPPHTRMEPCANDCTGIRLVVGADAIAWSFAPAATPIVIKIKRG